MPSSARSLRVTDEYRRRLGALRDRATAQARAAWRLDPADLDRTHEAWVAQTAVTLTELQRAGGRLSAAYLAAYLTAELGPVPPPVVNPDAGVGMTRHGVTLAAGLLPSLFTVKAAISEGHAPAEASRLGLLRAVGVVKEESIAPARAVVADAIREDERIVGWRRVTSGGCGACLAATDGEARDPEGILEVHPGCQCGQEPVVGDVSDIVRRVTGRDMFDALSTQGQDELLGHEKATLIREGLVPFGDLIQREHMAVLPDLIVETPLQDLQ